MLLVLPSGHSLSFRAMDVAGSTLWPKSKFYSHGCCWFYLVAIVLVLEPWMLLVLPSGHSLSFRAMDDAGST